VKFHIETYNRSSGQSKPRTIAKSVSTVNSNEVLYIVPAGRRFSGYAVPAYSGRRSCEIYIKGARYVVSYIENYQTFGFPLPLELDSGNEVSGYNASIIGVEYDA